MDCTFTALHEAEQRLIWSHSRLEEALRLGHVEYVVQLCRDAVNNATRMLEDAREWRNRAIAREQCQYQYSSLYGYWRP